MVADRSRGDGDRRGCRRLKELAGNDTVVFVLAGGTPGRGGDKENVGKGESSHGVSARRRKAREDDGLDWDAYGCGLGVA